MSFHTPVVRQLCVRNTHSRSIHGKAQLVDLESYMAASRSSDPVVSFLQ